MNRLSRAALSVLALLFAAVIPVQAVERTHNIDLQEKEQLIFLIDGSYSMADERWQEVLECTQMIDAMLPSNFQTALLVYSEDIDALVDYDQALGDRMAELKGRKQQGYTNPGAALNAALEMFDWNSSGGKYVLFISDGEISMPTAEGTEDAAAAYLDATAQAAEKGIIIDLLLYPTEDIEDRISDGAALTGGTRFYRTEGSTAETFAESYLFDCLGLERIMLGLADSSDNLASVSLQDTYAERVRILLTSESRIQDIHVSCQSRDIRVVQGENYAVITLEQPMEETASLQYTLAEKGRMNAYLVKEYHLTIQADASYINETGCQQIIVHAINSNGKDILEDPELRKVIGIYIDGKKASLEASQEKAVINWPAESSGNVTLKVDFRDLNSLVYYESAESTLWLDVPDAQGKSDGIQYLWLFIVVAGVCVTFIILLCLLLRSRQKKNGTSEGESTKTPLLDEILNYEFSGKVVVYVIKTADEMDIPPASINLYARGSRTPFSFEWIRSRCHIELNLPGADKIEFSGGANHTLCVRNSGDATAMQGKDILLRDKKYTLSYNDKVLLIFNNGETEIEVHYKSMKPSEREG